MRLHQKQQTQLPRKSSKVSCWVYYPRALLDLENDQLSQCLDNSGKAVMQFLFTCTHKVTHAALYHPPHCKYKQAAKICKAALLIPKFSKCLAYETIFGFNSELIYTRIRFQSMKPQRALKREESRSTVACGKPKPRKLLLCTALLN